MRIVMAAALTMLGLTACETQQLAVTSGNRPTDPAVSRTLQNIDGAERTDLERAIEHACVFALSINSPTKCGCFVGKVSNALSQPELRMYTRATYKIPLNEADRNLDQPQMRRNLLEVFVAAETCGVEAWTSPAQAVATHENWLDRDTVRTLRNINAASRADLDRVNERWCIGSNPGVNSMSCRCWVVGLQNLLSDDQMKSFLRVTWGTPPTQTDRSNLPPERVQRVVKIGEQCGLPNPG